MGILFLCLRAGFLPLWSRWSPFLGDKLSSGIGKRHQSVCRLNLKFPMSFKEAAFTSFTNKTLSLSHLSSSKFPGILWASLLPHARRKHSSWKQAQAGQQGHSQNCLWPLLVNSAISSLSGSSWPWPSQGCGHKMPSVFSSRSSCP